METVSGIAMAVTRKKNSNNKIEQVPDLFNTEPEENGSMSSLKASKVSSEIFAHSFNSTDSSTVMTDSKVSP